MALLNCCMEGLAAVFLLCLLLGSCLEQKGREIHNSYFQPMLLVCLLLVVADGLTNYLIVLHESGGKSLPALFQIFQRSYYIAYYACLILFVCYLYEIFSQRRKVPVWPFHVAIVACLCSMALWCIEGSNGTLFHYDVMGNTYAGPLYWLGQAGGYLAVALCLAMVIRYHRVLRDRELFALLSYFALPITLSILRAYLPDLAYMPLSFSVSVMLLYIFVQSERSRRLQESERRNILARIDLMTSQIQPHFLYNTLNTIYYLCDADPRRAKTAIGEFSSYLRGNLSAMKTAEPVFIERELEHVTYYLELEQIRFEDEVRYQIDLQAGGFLLPALTVQPLVENAVKHGLYPKEGGGLVTVRTAERADCYEVTVEDDGVGFRPELLRKEALEREGHVGLINVRERLWLTCRGTLEVESRVGQGTRVTVRIPRDAFSGREKSHESDRRGR